MLRVEESARKRFILLGVVVSVLLGGMVVSGLIERFSVPPALAEVPMNKEEVARLRLRLRREREQRLEVAYLGQKGRWQDTLSLLTRLDKDNKNTGFTFLRAEAKARGGDSDALREFVPLLDSSDPVSQATRLLLTGKTDDYRQFTQKTIDGAALDKVNAMQANNTAWLAVLAPNALPDYNKAIALAEKGIVGVDKRDLPNNLNTLGAVLYRAGRQKDAITKLLEAETMQQEPFNWPFLALAYHETGDKTNARAYYTKLHDYLNKTFGQSPGANRHELLMFYRETEAVFGSEIKGAMPIPASPVPAK